MQPIDQISVFFIKRQTEQYFRRSVKLQIYLQNISMSLPVKQRLDFRTTYVFLAVMKCQNQKAKQRYQKRVLCYLDPRSRFVSLYDKDIFWFNICMNYSHIVQNVDGRQQLQNKTMDRDKSISTCHAIFLICSTLNGLQL